MRILLEHETRYEYERSVYLTPHLFRLKPAAHSRTPIENFSLCIQPENHFIHWQQDPFGNFLARVDFKETVRELVLNVKILANIIPVNPFDFFIDESAQYFPLEYEPSLKKDISLYLEIVDTGAEILQWLKNIDRSKKEIVEFLIMVNQKIYEEISYNVRMEPGVQTSEISLSTGTGSCRDSAWLLVQVLRHLGLAARFVSGYLIQLDPHTKQSNDTCDDTIALHAWAEVYIPGAGWIGLDATSGLFAGEGHIPLACTPNPESAAPITGTSEMCKTTFTYHSSITRL